MYETRPALRMSSAKRKRRCRTYLLVKEVPFTGKKSYLSEQIRLMSLATYDLFTDQEYQYYTDMITCMNEIERVSSVKEENQKEAVKELKQKKKKLISLLADEIKTHRGTPRTVRLQNVLDLHKFRDEEGNLHLPQGITWWTLKLSKRIAEFASEESRAMGLGPNEITFDKIIIKWKSLDVLEQIVHDGFTMPILQEDGTVIQKKYRFHTASAGQIGLLNPFCGSAGSPWWLTEKSKCIVIKIRWFQ